MLGYNIDLVNTCRRTYSTRDSTQKNIIFDCKWTSYITVDLPVLVDDIFFICCLTCYTLLDKNAGMPLKIFQFVCNPEPIDLVIVVASGKV